MEMEGGVYKDSLLPPSPKYFENCRRLKYAAGSTSAFAMTSLGLQIQLPLVPLLRQHSNELNASSQQPLGYVGLLSCSPGSNSELLGIVLHSAGEGADSSKKLERVHFGEVAYPCNTVVVGPRAAAQSVLEAVTIVRDSESQAKRNLYWGYRQIFVNVSQTLREMGYSVTGGTRNNLGGVWSFQDDKPVWDPATTLFTVKGKYGSQDLLCFCFESHTGNPSAKFTIFMRTTTQRAMVHAGSSFSPGEIKLLHGYLENSAGETNPDDMVAVGDDGNLFQLKIEINAKKVYGWQIYEMNVDAFPRPLPVSMLQSHWYWAWKQAPSW